MQTTKESKYLRREFAMNSHIEEPLIESNGGPIRVPGMVPLKGPFEDRDDSIAGRLNSDSMYTVQANTMQNARKAPSRSTRPLSALVLLSYVIAALFLLLIALAVLAMAPA